MMRLLVVVLAAFVAAPAAAQSVSTDIRQAPTGRYALETRHSQVLFSILHMGTTYFHGRFDHQSGTLALDSAEPEKSNVAITIDTGTIDTPSPELNTMLAASDVFDAKAFPQATFVSTSIARTGPSTGRITGNLTIRNVTKPVTLDATFIGGNLNPMNNSYAIGFSATATIKRSDFGLTTMRWGPFVGDDVKLVIEALFQQQKE